MRDLIDSQGLRGSYDEGNYGEPVVRNTDFQDSDAATPWRIRHGFDQPERPERSESSPRGRTVTIVLSAQPGVDASEIGRRVARSLWLDYYDRILLKGVARRLRASISAVHEREQFRRPLRVRLTDALERAARYSAMSIMGDDPAFWAPTSRYVRLPLDRTGPVPGTRRMAIELAEFAAALSTEVAAIQGHGDAVIVHPAACALFDEAPDVFRVGVFANWPDRVDRFARQTRTRGRRQVERVLRQCTDASNDFARAYYGVSLLDPSRYDMTINVSTVSADEAAEQIAATVRSRIDRRFENETKTARLRRAARSAESRRAKRAPAMDFSTVTDLLERSDAFRALPASQVRQIAALGELVSVPAGTTLASEEAFGETFYVVVSGQIELSANSALGKITLRIAGPGESFPIAGLLGTGRLITTASAMDDLALWQVDCGVLHEFFDRRPDIGVHVYDTAARVMAERYRQTVSRLTRTAERALLASPTQAPGPAQAPEQERAE